MRGGGGGVPSRGAMNDTSIGADRCLCPVLTTATTGGDTDRPPGREKDGDGDGDGDRDGPSTCVKSDVLYTGIR